MNAIEQQIIEKIQLLPPTRLTEVVDFVDFLRSRETERGMTQAASQVAATSFAAVWDNETDAVYDKL
jgi:hypothetical protein